MMLRTLWGRMQCVEQRAGTVIVDTAAEATLLQREAAPLSLLCCCCDLSVTLEEWLQSKWTMCPRESWCGVSYGILLQNYEGFENFVGKFFEDIFCGFRKSACERKRRLVPFAERW